MFPAFLDRFHHLKMFQRVQIYTQSGLTASGHEIQGGETGYKLDGWTWLDGPLKFFGIDISSPSPWICHAQAQWNDMKWS